MAHINRPRVRETSTTTGTTDFTLAGRMFGSVAFASYMATGDTCDYCASYADSFEEGLGTMAADGKLTRTTVYRSRHANGTLDTNKVSFAAGVKTIILTFGTPRITDMVVLQTKALRADVVQSLSTGEKKQAADNMGFFPSGFRMPAQQTSAPAGWTKELNSSYDDAAFKCVTGTPGTGGTVAFSTLHARTATDTFAIGQTNLPNVNFTVSGITLTNNAPSGITSSNLGALTSKAGSLNAGGEVFVGIAGAGGSPTLTQNTQNTVVNTQGSAASGGSGTVLSANIDMRVKRVDMIIIQRD